jgi:hypothetical protein
MRGRHNPRDRGQFRKGSLMNDADDEVYRQLVEHAMRISRLADQASDQRIKIHLIGLTYELLDATQLGMQFAALRGPEQRE